jgi:hypothetical protein
MVPTSLRVIALVALDSSALLYYKPEETTIENSKYLQQVRRSSLLE